MAAPGSGGWRCSRLVMGRCFPTHRVCDGWGTRVLCVGEVFDCSEAVGVAVVGRRWGRCFPTHETPHGRGPVRGDPVSKSYARWMGHPAGVSAAPGRRVIQEGSAEQAGTGEESYVAAAAF